VCEKAKQLQLSQQEHGNHQNSSSSSSSSREFGARPSNDVSPAQVRRQSRAQTFNYNSSSGWEAYAGPGAAAKKRTGTLIGNSKERPREAEACEQLVALPPSITHIEPGPGGDGAHATAVEADASGAQLRRHRPGGPAVADGEPVDDEAVSIVVTSAPTEEHEQQQGETTATATARGRTATWLSAYLPEEHDEHERLMSGGQQHQASSAPSPSAVYEEPANITRLRSRSAGFPHRQGTR
jgi:hypothetical protein